MRSDSRRDTFDCSEGRRSRRDRRHRSGADQASLGRSCSVPSWDGTQRHFCTSTFPHNLHRMSPWDKCRCRTLLGIQDDSGRSLRGNRTFPADSQRTGTGTLHQRTLACIGLTGTYFHPRRCFDLAGTDTEKNLASSGSDARTCWGAFRTRRYLRTPCGRPSTGSLACTSIPDRTRCCGTCGRNRRCWFRSRESSGPRSENMIGHRFQAGSPDDTSSGRTRRC